MQSSASGKTPAKSGCAACLPWILPCTYAVVSCLAINRQSSALQIALVLIDEVHLLADGRGMALETGVVSRIKMVSKDTGMQEVRSCALVFACTQFKQKLDAERPWPV